MGKRIPVIVLHDVEGIARHSGVDQEGAQWLEQFFNELEDSAIECWYDDDEHTGKDLSRYTARGYVRAILPYLPICCLCNRPIRQDAWLCLDGGEQACDKHFTMEELNNDNG